MKEKIKNLYTKYREVIQYLIFGVLTTVVNFVVYFILRHIFGLEGARGVIINTVANIVAILFAYVTNRIYVFQSKSKGFKAVFFEMVSFFSCRVITLLNDIFVYWLGFNVLGFPDVAVKFVGQVIIVVLNYILSKLIVFRKKSEEKENEV